jgi:hypothetical protein
LHIPQAWLKRWVTDRSIPHQRSGKPGGVQQREVWFTWADILAIGLMLPELMTPRQTKRAAAANGDRGEQGAPDPLPSDAEIARWAQLTSGR